MENKWLIGLRSSLPMRNDYFVFPRFSLLNPFLPKFQQSTSKSSPVRSNDFLTIIYVAIKMFHNNTYASGTAFRREASVSHLKRKWRFWVIDQSKRMSWVIDVALFCKHSVAFQKCLQTLTFAYFQENR